MAPISHAIAQSDGCTQLQVPAADAPPQPPASQEGAVGPAPAPVEGASEHGADPVVAS
ncbi:hypothetical protein FRC08_015231 [Ceratobasidium sp. 394]|nr:hypothetical protein FRC08_015231 [Ceratobasidium sp. 394]KAG9088883.1 hypothetical protein FS749_001777 [Ceratobasidium sp. UAMH 11750]